MGTLTTLWLESIKIQTLLQQKFIFTIPIDMIIAVTFGFSFSIVIFAISPSFPTSSGYFELFFLKINYFIQYPKYQFWSTIKILFTLFEYYTCYKVSKKLKTKPKREREKRENAWEESTDVRRRVCARVGTGGSLLVDPCQVSHSARRSAVLSDIFSDLEQGFIAGRDLSTEGFKRR